MKAQKVFWSIQKLENPVIKLYCQTDKAGALGTGAVPLAGTVGSTAALALTAWTALNVATDAWVFHGLQKLGSFKEVGTTLELNWESDLCFQFKAAGEFSLPSTDGASIRYYQTIEFTVINLMQRL